MEAYKSGWSASLRLATNGLVLMAACAAEETAMNAFVIGPIGDQLAQQDSEARRTYEQAIEVYEEVIIEAWVAAGESRDDIERADGIDRPGDIPEQVVKALLSADVVIADLTGG